MRISTKIITGYAVLIGMIASLAIYGAVSAVRMQSTVAKLSSADFRAGRLLLELMRDRDLIEEYAGKSFALRDPDYATQLQSFFRSFDSVISELRSTVRSPAALRELEGATTVWIEFRREMTTYLDAPAQRWPSALPDPLQAKLDQLRDSLAKLYQSTLEVIDSEVQASRRTARDTEVVSWAVAGLALILSSLISFLIVRSIDRPLKQLTAGTRAIAQGEFTCQLDTSAPDEFSALASDFNFMTRRLSELDKLKKGFVSHVSHELKSPLASMQDNIRLLLDQLPGPLTEKQRRLLDLNLQSARRLSTMIFNLLDLSRIEAGTMSYEMKPNDLADVIRTAVAETESRIRERNLTVQVTEVDRVVVDCDHDRILQVLMNLLDNAIKFSPPSTCIEVSAGRTTEAGRTYARVVIADAGPGVPDGQKEKIFEHFHQTSNAGRMAGQGVGLGLAIARTIVKAHKGAIWVEDNPGGGSRFVVLLPHGEMEHHAMASAPL